MNNTPKLNELPPQKQHALSLILQHFELREDPFGATPNPRFLYLTEGHREALTALEDGIQHNRGFLVLIARPGLGKTTLLYHLLDKYKNAHTTSTAFIFQTQCNSRELIRHVVSDLGLGPDDEDIVHLHEKLNRFLVQQANSGRRVVVFIDEAQDLNEEVLETVRLLSNFETLNAKLLQVVLSGQPSLANRLSSRGLLQLAQRVFSTIRLDSLTAAEASAYIDHRLSVAGYEGDGLFTSSARSLLISQSAGVPRLLNALCFRALVLAHEQNLRVIDDLTAQRAIKYPAFEVLQSAPLQQVPEMHNLEFNHPAQLIRSVRIRDQVPMKDLPGVLEAIRSAESELDGHGYVVVRYSNQEKSASVMVEAENEALSRKYLDTITNALQSQIGAL